MRLAVRSPAERGGGGGSRAAGWTTTISGAADVCAALEDRVLAVSLYELLAPCADVMTMQVGPLGGVVGRLALTLGRPDEAEAHLRAAVTLCERMDARAFLAIACYDLGGLLLPSPEGTALRRMLDDGVTLAGSSDYPVSHFDVLSAVKAAATRRTRLEETLEPEQAISVEDALRAYTQGSALALGVANDVATISTEPTWSCSHRTRSRPPLSASTRSRSSAPTSPADWPSPTAKCCTP